jgi:hypothetical protein
MVREGITLMTIETMVVPIVRTTETRAMGTVALFHHSQVLSIHQEQPPLRRATQVLLLELNLQQIGRKLLPVQNRRFNNQAELKLPDLKFAHKVHLHEALKQEQNPTPELQAKKMVEEDKSTFISSLENKDDIFNYNKNGFTPPKNNLIFAVSKAPYKNN